MIRYGAKAKSSGVKAKHAGASVQVPKAKHAEDKEKYTGDKAIQRETVGEVVRGFTKTRASG
ncbi:MAG: hypothetical protein BAA01_16175 [Bacillus thermozeamaize]|uniref:Uncharacterized protein n=1 Tax=Bacillus thermozeamaize TaxID=230954 RepID=A0A1Y3PYV8_9BACI|nr:MAG: hypothetical protein BAA01_16175 [Bacillus thermozeamaize]